MKKSLLIFILFSSLACTKKDFNISNLNNNEVSIIGHGGIGIDKNYPINSMESMLKAVVLGADGIEIDVQMTKDSVLVAYHSRNLDSQTYSKGKIHEKTWNEIKHTTYKYPPHSNYKLVRVRDILNNLSSLSQLQIFLDCKNYNPDKSTEYVSRYNNAILQIIYEFNILENSHVEIRRSDQVKTLPILEPKLSIFYYHVFDVALANAILFDLNGISINISEVTQENMALAHDNRIMVSTYNVYSNKEHRKAFTHHVDFLQSDRIPYALKLKRNN